MLGCLVGFTITTCAPVDQAVNETQDSVVVEIASGGFAIADSDPLISYSKNGQLEVSIPADHPVALTFASLDFVYTVQQTDMEMAIVVLPKSSVTRTQSFKPGRWPIDLVQGCGRLFATHEESIVLNALAQSESK